MDKMKQVLMENLLMVSDMVVYTVLESSGIFFFCLLGI